jgi:hypothetical protein
MACTTGASDAQRAYMSGGADVRLRPRVEGAVQPNPEASRTIIVHPQNAKTNPEEFVRQKRLARPVGAASQIPKTLHFGLNQPLT